MRRESLLVKALAPWFVMGFLAVAVFQCEDFFAVHAQTIGGPKAAVSLGGALPTPLPLFPATNWWNLDITSAPVDGNSSGYITFIGPTKGVHPDFGGVDEDNLPDGIYGFPYIVVDGTQPKKTVLFGPDADDESDGVDHNTNTSVPFYPIPDEAITQAHWIESGQAGNVDKRASSDRHMLIVDRDNKYLYELYNVFYDGANWRAYSGAFFDMKTNNRRTEGWTSADAAGLAILPGLVRYDEVYGSPAEINHAIRMTVRSSNGYVYPASHRAGSTTNALPMGARLRLKSGKTVTSMDPGVLKIVRALKKYGLIVADNGSDMYISGTFHTSWDNGILNPALGQLNASDFEVIQLGYNPPPTLPTLAINDVSVAEGNSGTSLMTFTVTLSIPSASTVTVNWTTANGTATAGSDYAAGSGTLTFAPGETAKTIAVTINGDVIFEANESYTVTLSGATNATIADAQGVGTITNDDSSAPIVVTGTANGLTDSGATLNGTVNPNGSATNASYQYGLTLGYGSSTTPSSVGSGIAAVSVPVAISNLQCNMLYHFRVVGTNASTSNGSDGTFITAACPAPPTAVTGAATTFTQTGATLNGMVNPNSATATANARFEYGLTNGYGLITPDVPIGNGTVAVSSAATVTGLACNTQFHFRAVGQNSGGTGNGADLTFTTATCPASGAENISPAKARVLAVNSTDGDTLSMVRSEIWYQAALYANRSYQISVWTVGEDGAMGSTSLSIKLFSDPSGAIAATPAPTSVSGSLEGSPNGAQANLSASSMFQPTSSGQYRIRILGAPSAAETAVNVMIRETTLFSPWLFTTLSTGYDAYHTLHNNTSQTVSVTLRSFGSAGAAIGNTLTFSVPANATVFKTSKLDMGLNSDSFGGTVLTHTGAFGAISANTTTLSGTTGLSFDSPFTPRSGPGQGGPIR